MTWRIFAWSRCRLKVTAKKDRKVIASLDNLIEPMARIENPPFPGNTSTPKEGAGQKHEFQPKSLEMTEREERPEAEHSK
jgi:hypothetical protein